MHSPAACFPPPRPGSAPPGAVRPQHRCPHTVSPNFLRVQVATARRRGTTTPPPPHCLAEFPPRLPPRASAPPRPRSDPPANTAASHTVSPDFLRVFLRASAPPR